MPTGYTASVQDGSITDFSVFAMRCARAFGALVMMRDEPHDASIPTEFLPSTYNAEALVKAQAEIRRLEAMTEDEIQAAASKDFADRTVSWENLKKERMEHRARYNAMLEKVLLWTPPSDDHQELKKFMIQQLQESIRFDCSAECPPPVQVASRDWYAKAVMAAQHDLIYHAEADKKERERTAARNKWVADLRASLAPQIAAE